MFKVPALVHQIRSSVFTWKLLHQSLENCVISHKCVFDGHSDQWLSAAHLSSLTKAFSPQRLPASVMKQHVHMEIESLFRLNAALEALV